MNKTLHLQECIAACRQCHEICLQTVEYCLAQGGTLAEPSRVRAMLDCADLCQTSVAFMLRGSELHHLTCEVCADVCEHCAKGCEETLGVEQLMECAETCRACASICREMAGRHLLELPIEDVVEIEREETLIEPTHAQIAAVARQLFEAEGRPAGRDQEYWFRAERMLMERAQTAETPLV